jgi:hypothetical protein
MSLTGWRRRCLTCRAERTPDASRCRRTHLAGPTSPDPPRRLRHAGPTSPAPPHRTHLAGSATPAGVPLWRHRFILHRPTALRCFSLTLRCPKICPLGAIVVLPQRQPASPLESGPTCERSSGVEHQLPKLRTRVRFPSLALCWVARHPGRVSRDIPDNVGSSDSGSSDSGGEFACQGSPTTRRRCFKLEV